MLAVAAGRPLTIYGNGKQVRDLLFVDDLVRAFKLAAFHIETTAGNVYNMGGGPDNSVSVWQELRPRLDHFSAKALQVDLARWRPGDQPIYVSDTRLAERDFSWKPRVGIDEGLRRLWDWAQELNGLQPKAASEPKRTSLRLPVAQPGVAFAGPSA